MYWPVPIVFSVHHGVQGNSYMSVTKQLAQCSVMKMLMTDQPPQSLVELHQGYVGH